MTLIRINHRPSRAQLFVFAIAWLVVVGVFAAARWRKGDVVAAAMAAGIALAMPVLWGFAAGAVRLAFVGLSYLTYPIGFVLSHVVLAVIYFGIFTPLGLALRLSGRDELGRTFDRNASTYWIRRDGHRTAADYLRQR